MAIASAVQNGSTVYVYDERGMTLYTKSGNLQGFTSTTVNVRIGTTMYIYDERGRTKFTKSVR